MLNAKGHVDSKYFVPNLENPGESIFANDGGLYYSSNNTSIATAPTFNQNNYGYNTSEYESIDLHPQSGKNEWVGGTQDNGDLFSESNGTYANFNGDGYQAFYDIDDPKTMTFNYANGPSLVYQIANHTNIQSQSTGSVFGFTPIAWDSRDNLSYSGSYAGHFSRQNFSTHVSNTFSLPFISTNNLINYRVSFIKIDPTINHRIWLGVSGITLNGMIPLLIRVDNANSTPTFTNMSSALFATNAYLHDIYLDANNSNVVAVCFSNLEIDRIWYFDGNVWKIHDGYLPPNLNVNSIMKVPAANSPTGTMTLIGTNKGLWCTVDLKEKYTLWQVADDLPFSNTKSLCFRSSDAIAAVGTYGNGVWMTKSFSSNSSAPSFVLNKYTACVGEQVYIYNTSLGKTAAFTWNCGNGNTYTNINPPPQSYNSPGSYTITLTMGGQFYSRQVLVFGTPPVTVTDPPLNSIYKVGRQIYFSYASCDIPTSVTWNFGDGGTSSSNFPIHPYTTEGTYQAEVTLNNDPLQKASVVIVIDNINGSKVSFSRKYNPNENINNWQVYPNPTFGKLFIKNSNFHNKLHLQISDVNGKEVNSTYLDFNEQASFMLPKSLADGIYLLKIVADNKIFYAQKIVLIR